jgi:hypothetical protein
MVATMRLQVFLGTQPATVSTVLRTIVSLLNALLLVLIVLASGSEHPAEQY